MKQIFFVLTFGSIYDRVLPMIEEKKDKGEIVVVAPTDQIEAFFKNYTDFKVIRTKVYPDLITRNTKRKIFSNIIRSKIEYRKLFKDIKDAEIYFYNNGCAVVIFSYIKKLSKRNKVFQYPSTSPDNVVKHPIEHGFRAFVMRWIAKWLMNVETCIINNKGYPYWALDKKFHKNMEVILGYEGDKKPLEKYMVNIDELKGKKILIAIEDSISAGTIEKSEFISKMDTFIDILDSVAPGGYTIKAHPRVNKLYGKMSKYSGIIPPNVPFEFVLHHNWDAIIGIDSTALKSAARYTDAKVISLIDMVKFKDEKFKKMFRDWLEKDLDDKIIFPKDMEDLRKLLEKIIRR